jgi:ribokinase
MSPSSKQICVVGSINQDLVASTPHIPTPGETILGSSFASFAGGKGANQAYAAARLGAQTRIIGAVGEDSFGDALSAGLSAVGVDVSGVQRVAGLTGLAIIAHAPGGENSIIVIPGANSEVSPAQLDSQKQHIHEAGIILAQLEVPIETVEHLGRMAMEAGVPFMLDPAPAQCLTKSLLRCVTWLTPNETEQQILLGTERMDPEEAARQLLATGVRNVALKLGPRGVYLAGADCKAGYVPGFTVEAVDTTAAGDVFNAGFAVGLMRGIPAREAARLGAAAAAISVTRRGAQNSAPTLAEVDGLLRQ